MPIINIRKHPEYKQAAVDYVHEKWANAENKQAYQEYEALILASFSSKEPLPAWYLMIDDDQIIGCAGLIENDFTHRKDLSPWLCALFIEENFRGKSLGSQLIRQIQKDAVHAGFSKLYLSTHHTGYYEKYGFNCIGKRCPAEKARSNLYECLLSDLMSSEL